MTIESTCRCQGGDVHPVLPQSRHGCFGSDREQSMASTACGPAGRFFNKGLPT